MNLSIGLRVRLRFRNRIRDTVSLEYTSLKGTDTSNYNPGLVLIQTQTSEASCIRYNRSWVCLCYGADSNNIDETFSTCVPVYGLKIHPNNLECNRNDSQLLNVFRYSEKSLLQATASGPISSRG